MRNSIRILFSFCLIFGVQQMPAGAAGSTPSLGWAGNATVQTAYGDVRGFSDKGNTWCWRGIPYARPPVGPLRWKAPLDPLPWKGIRKATRFPAEAPQSLPLVGVIGSEDCLYLNVWRPRSPETKLPVYVFFHGGGNSIGSGNSVDYYGHAVAGESKMVYVTVNFRLGVMGWFRHPAVTGKGSPEDQSGNYGTLDLIQSLRWIQKNIEAFGGDPGNVTIAGESGGAFDVLSLLTSPLASGLFHRAVCESGINMIYSVKQAEDQTESLIKAMLVADEKAKDLAQAESVYRSMPALEIDAYLRGKTPGELMKNIPRLFGVMARWMSIYTDGTVLPAGGYGVFTKGTWANKVPLLIGVNKDEMSLFNLLQRDPPPGSRMFDLATRYKSMLWRVCGLDTVAVQMTLDPHAPPVYAYRFDWGSQDSAGKSVLPGSMGKILGSNHYAEIPFFLGMRRNQLSKLTGKNFTRENQPGREKLTRACLSYLANFARSGDPNGSSLARREACNPTPGAFKYIILDAGYRELRIGRGTDTMTVQRVIGLMNSELVEPEKSTFIRQLTDPLPFGLAR